MLKGLIYNSPFMFSCKAFSLNDLNFFPEDIHASNNLTDSGRRKYDYSLRKSYSIRSVDRKYVLFSTKCLVITYLLIVSQLIL
jgi:hypothetical protein